MPKCRKGQSCSQVTTRQDQPTPLADQDNQSNAAAQQELNAPQELDGDGRWVGLSPEGQSFDNLKAVNTLLPRGEKASPNLEHRFGDPLRALSSMAGAERGILRDWLEDGFTGSPANKAARTALVTADIQAYTTFESQLMESQAVLAGLLASESVADRSWLRMSSFLAIEGPEDGRLARLAEPSEDSPTGLVMDEEALQGEIEDFGSAMQASMHSVPATFTTEYVDFENAISQIPTKVNTLRVGQVGLTSAILATRRTLIQERVGASRTRLAEIDKTVAAFDGAGKMVNTIMTLVGSTRGLGAGKSPLNGTVGDEWQAAAKGAALDATTHVGKLASLAFANEVASLRARIDSAAAQMTALGGVLGHLDLRQKMLAFEVSAMELHDHARSLEGHTDQMTTALRQIGVALDQDARDQGVLADDKSAYLDMGLHMATIYETQKLYEPFPPQFSKQATDMRRTASALSRYPATMGGAGSSDIVQIRGICEPLGAEVDGIADAVVQHSESHTEPRLNQVDSLGDKIREVMSAATVKPTTPG